MKTPVLLSLLLALVAVVSVTGSPTTGKRNLQVKVGALGEIELQEKFRGGERACVIVKGDHNPVVDLRVSVFDEKNNLVAKDDRGGDLVVAVWYPPRDAIYKVRIHNPGKEYNGCYVSFK